MRTMPHTWRQLITHPALAAVSTVLWGVVEVFALLRARLRHQDDPVRR